MFRRVLILLPFGHVKPLASQRSRHTMHEVIMWLVLQAPWNKLCLWNGLHSTNSGATWIGFKTRLAKQLRSVNPAPTAFTQSVWSNIITSCLKGYFQKHAHPFFVLAHLLQNPEWVTKTSQVPKLNMEGKIMKSLHYKFNSTEKR